MAIKREKLRDGIFVQEIVTADAPKDVLAVVREILDPEKHGIEARLRRHETRAQAYLAAKGLPTDWHGLVGRYPESFPAEVRDAAQVLRRVHAVREALARGDAPSAAEMTARLAEQAMREDLRPIAPLAEDGARMAEDRKKGGKASKYAKGIQAAVDDLVRQYPRASAKDCWRDLGRYTSDEPLFVDEYEVYADGDHLHQVGNQGKIRKIGCESFRRYVTRAKDSSRSN